MKKSVVHQQLPLSIERLKTYKGFEQCTEQEALAELEIIKRLAKIMHHLYLHDMQLINNQTQ